MGPVKKRHLATPEGYTMSTTLTERVSASIPTTGSRSWWLLYLFAPILVVVGGLLAFPDLVYDRFI